jgi:hypothetical protein
MPKLRIGHPLQTSCSQNCQTIKIFDQRRLLLSIGLGAVVALCFAIAWRNCSGESLPLGSPSWLEFGVVLVTLSLGHEALHLVGFPRRGLDSNTVIGLWLEFGSPYVQYLSPMSRNQFLLATILPFAVLSILPVVFAANDIGSVAYLSWISVLNCVGAGSDLLVFAKTLAIVPANAWVLENGESMLWGHNDDIESAP